MRTQFHKELVQDLVVQSCINCENWDEKAEGCTLAGGQRPPAKVVVYGCPAWVPYIPF